jgi:hypothetical protein
MPAISEINGVRVKVEKIMLGSFFHYRSRQQPYRGNRKR